MPGIALLSEDLSAIEAYPATLEQIAAVYPGFQLGTVMNDEYFSATLRLVLVRDTPEPDLQFGERANPAPPEFDGTVWRDVWTISSIPLPQAKERLRLMARGLLEDRGERLSSLEHELLGELGRLQSAQDAGDTIVPASYPLLQDVAAKRNTTFSNAAAFANSILRMPWLNRADNFAGRYLDVLDRIQAIQPGPTALADAYAIYLELEALS